MKFPIVLFLKYDPKDVVIVIGGLIFGPLTSFAITVVVSVMQMLTISGTGIWGWSCQVAVMMLWNYLIAPIYLGYPREAVAKLLLPAFLPFNLIKGGLNAAITILLYKPVVTVLLWFHLIEPLN